MAEPKYLAVHDWSDHQSGKGDMQWIKVRCHLEDNDKISGLSLFQMGLLIGLWRLRGRTGKNILNDPTKIARALHVTATDRPHLPHAIRTLIARMLLVPTDQQDSFSENRIDKSREEEKREEKSASEPASIPLDEKTEVLAPEGVDTIVAEIQSKWAKNCGQLGVKACLEAFDFESQRKHMDFLDAARQIRDKTLIIAGLMAEWPPGERKFIPKLTDFMAQAQYENEFKTWERGDAAKKSIYDAIG